MTEIWKDIPGYEGLYQVSNTGFVKSFRQSSKFGKPKEYILKNTMANNGYAQITLYDSGKRKKFLVHRLVAEAFIPNPNNFTQVNHIDENPANNSVDNLEWCTAKYNNAFGTAKTRSLITRLSNAKKVEQRMTNGTFLALYASLSIAEMITGISAQLIGDCCRGHSKSAAGFLWKFADD